jgi:NADH-quinone oxidoreductase subunit H
MLSELSLLLTLFLVLMTLFVVLLERKFLAYAQRRMGPTLMGRNGVFQLALDLVKLLTKETFLLPRPSSALAPIVLALLYVVQISFSQTFVFGNSLSIFSNVDSLILYHLTLVLLSNLCFALVGLVSQSRYATLGTFRSFVHVLSLDIFITVTYSLLVLLSQSAHFHERVLFQSNLWLVFLLPPLASTFVVLLILEAKRAPFDHAETESEVVAGYAVEYNGSMLLIFYLAEYLHLIVAGVHWVIFFCGGWWLLSWTNFINPLIFIPTQCLGIF